MNGWTVFEAPAARFARRRRSRDVRSNLRKLGAIAPLPPPPSLSLCAANGKEKDGRKRNSFPLLEGRKEKKEG